MENCMKMRKMIRICIKFCNGNYTMKNLKLWVVNLRYYMVFAEYIQKQKPIYYIKLTEVLVNKSYPSLRCSADALVL